jgi:CHASE2 domain-containing sensor protein
VLGLDAPPGSRLWRESGATAFPVDPDRAVRTYLRQFVTQRGRLDSLPYAVARRALPQETAAALQPDDRKRLLSLWGGPLVLAGSCVESNRAPGTFLACSMKAALANPAGLRDKIVIVSGIYREANDFHATANGKLPGVELVADALQTEAGGGGPVVFSEFESMLVGAVIGTILTIAYMMLGVAAGILVNIAAAAGLFFIFKYRPEYGIGSLFPIPVVFFLLYLYHIANEYRDEIIHQVHRIFLSSRARGAGQSGVDP